MNKPFLYKNIFMYSSLQFCGHIEEYFASHTEKLVVFLVMPRVKNKFNLFRVYKKGKLTVEKRAWSSNNPVLYYLSWYVHYVFLIFYYFSPQEKFIILSTHPISFIGMAIQRLLRRAIFVYWIGDHFPPTNRLLYFFEKLKKFYHERVSFRYYLSERINKQMNSGIIEDKTHKTVMWGVKPIFITRKVPKNNLNLLFIGLIKREQGLEKLFLFLRTHKQYSLKIIGICDDVLFTQYQGIISQYKIANQIFFPNKFFSDDELQEIAGTCHVGIALYDISPLGSTYYTDPGKVKAYTEMNLPVIMSNTSGISSYIKKFSAGEVLSEKPGALERALIEMRKNYSKYIKGLKQFNRFFYYESYYQKAFKELESI